MQSKISFVLILLAVASPGSAMNCNPRPVFPDYTMAAFFNAWEVLGNQAPSGSADRLALEYLNAKHWRQANINMTFSKVNLSGKNFSSAQVPQIHLHNANLEGARFTEAKICNANFQITNLKGVNFARAILTHAVMHRADASDTQWGGAILKDADISDVDFNNAAGLTQQQLDQACYRASIGLPKNLPAGLSMSRQC